MDSSRQQATRRRTTHQGGFDFTRHARRLCDDMVRRLPELRHIDLSRVALSFSQTRKNVGHGLYASLTPLRFPGGSTHTIRRGQKWTVQRMLDASGREMLYILSFYLPRFLDQGLHEKLVTVVHELWHISPRFDGDLRRYRGRCYAHSGSQKRYDAHVRALAHRWLALEPPEATYAFLRYNFNDLVDRYGRVYGMKIPAPKMIRME